MGPWPRQRQGPKTPEPSVGSPPHCAGPPRLGAPVFVPEPQGVRLFPRRARRAESQALFSKLVDHLLQDRYVYTHRWRINDALAWDNRRCMHAAAGTPIGQRRRGLRTTLAGDWVVGRLYDQSFDPD